MINCRSMKFFYRSLLCLRACECTHNSTSARTHAPTPASCPSEGNSALNYLRGEDALPIVHIFLNSLATPIRSSLVAHPWQTSLRLEKWSLDGLTMGVQSTGSILVSPKHLTWWTIAAFLLSSRDMISPPLSKTGLHLPERLRNFLILYIIYANDLPNSQPAVSSLYILPSHQTPNTSKRFSKE